MARSRNRNASDAAGATVAPEGSAGDEPVIDAELEPGPGPELSPIRADAALPQAGDVRAMTTRREREVAVRTVAVATASGVVAGAASVALVKAARHVSKSAAKPSRKRRRRKDVVASQSFLVDVHVLRSGR